MPRATDTATDRCSFGGRGRPLPRRSRRKSEPRAMYSDTMARYGRVQTPMNRTAGRDGHKMDSGGTGGGGWGVGVGVGGPRAQTGGQRLA